MNQIRKLIKPRVFQSVSVRCFSKDVGLGVEETLDDKVNFVYNLFYGSGSKLGQTNLLKKKWMEGAPKKHDMDTGSAAVQVACLTARVENLQLHIDKYNKDKKSKRSLAILRSRRKALIGYMRRQQPNEYLELLKTIDLNVTKELEIM